MSAVEPPSTRSSPRNRVPRILPSRRRPALLLALPLLLLPLLLPPTPASAAPDPGTTTTTTTTPGTPCALPAPPAPAATPSPVRSGSTTTTLPRSPGTSTPTTAPTTTTSPVSTTSTTSTTRPTTTTSSSSTTTTKPPSRGSPSPGAVPGATTTTTTAPTAGGCPPCPVSPPSTTPPAPATPGGATTTTTSSTTTTTTSTTTTTAGAAGPGGSTPAPTPATPDCTIREDFEAVWLTSQIQSDGQQLEILSELLDKSLQQVVDLDRQLAVKSAQVAAARSRLAQVREVLRRGALQAYMTDSTGTAIAQIFSGSPDEVESSKVYREVAGGNLNQVVATFDEDARTLSTQLRILQATRDARATSTLEVATAREGATQAESLLHLALAEVQSQGSVATLVGLQELAWAASQQASFDALVKAEAASPLVLPPLPADPAAAAAVKAAESQVGVPYVWGGETPREAFDCSGLTQWSWAQAGVVMPRTAQEQYDAIAHVPLSDLQPGDLLFWDDGTTSVQHVAMYLGADTVIQAPYTGADVGFAPVWVDGLVGAGRP